MVKLVKEEILKRVFQAIRALEITLVEFIIRTRLKSDGGKKVIRITLQKWLIALTGIVL